MVLLHSGLDADSAPENPTSDRSLGGSGRGFGPQTRVFAFAAIKDRVLDKQTPLPGGRIYFQLEPVEMLQCTEKACGAGNNFPSSFVNSLPTRGVVTI